MTTVATRGQIWIVQAPVTGANVTGVQVACMTNAYTISGAVSGLNTGTQLTVLNNAGDAVTVSANGPFTFATSIRYNNGYAVTVRTQPVGQICTVKSGSGTVGAANVTDVQVACVNTYKISGTVSGLNTGAQVTLRNNGGGATTIRVNGPFTFAAYGTTGNGGPTGAGTVFEITPSGVETVIYSFTGQDGIGPAGLVQGRDGNFYGTTGSGGPNFNGTVFMVTPAGVMTILHSFAGGADGIDPAAALTLGSDGNFYGTTSNGGTNNLGTAFKITPAGVETVLHSFSGGAGDGTYPFAALIQGIDGNFYGTTQSGGPSGHGTVFKITSAGTETVLHSFVGGTTDGSAPYAALVQGTDGNFYGTTSAGGTSNNGTAFKIAPGGLESVIHSFAGGTVDGSSPQAALIQGRDGNFYGANSGGGASQSGNFIKMTPGGMETVIYSFNSGPEGQVPVGLVQGKDGAFYGTTRGGGTDGNGTVFKLTSNGVETALYSFAEGTTDGYSPSSLIQGSDEDFYGTTQQGGTNNEGTVFRITPTGTETVLYSFSGGPDGGQPQAALIQGSDGNFYGTAITGGLHGQGTVFRITPSGLETTLFSFTGGADGGQSQAALIQGADGNFYGTTVGGGASGQGTVFRITSTGVETVLHSFAGGPADGSHPYAALVQGADGSLYGTTTDGGASNQGTVFRVTSTGVETLLYSFAGGFVGVADGGEPGTAADSR